MVLAPDHFIAQNGPPTAQEVNLGSTAFGGTQLANRRGVQYEIIPTGPSGRIACIGPTYRCDRSWMAATTVLIGLGTQKFILMIFPSGLVNKKSWLVYGSNINSL